ncbi:PepSY domain-containing protein [Croceicoccus hydrothermalis]|uniref:PepSY domain-containing protein n=1 Tax=Croceicoccus hydrothermalis TaxID=2867964 RepID=UPI0023BA589C|nr:PepSY domain-containing protein [Croceicoccus hydrothermalis]
MRDWHKGAGLMGLGLLILLTSTGIMLELPAQTDSAWDAAGLTVADPAAPVAPPTPAGSQPIAPSRAIATALAALPGARLAWIETPGAARATYRFRMQVAGDPSYRFPHSYVHIDASNGAVVHIVDARRASPGRSITNWLHTVHAEAGLGLPGRIVTFLAGLLPFVLFVTGYLRWKKRAGTRSCGKKGHTSGNS